MNVLSVTVDAGVLVVPPEDSTADDAERYVETLLDCAKLRNESWVAMYKSEGGLTALCDDELYPIYGNLESLFAAHRIEHLTPRDVNEIVTWLLQLPSFEERLGVRDVLTDSLSVKPDNVLELAAGNALQSELARCLILIAILRLHCGDPICNHCLILRRAPAPAVTVKAIIQDLDHSRDDLNELPTDPEKFRGDVLICDDFKGLVQTLNESSILACSKDNIGLETAIRVALYKSRLERSKNPNWDDLLRGLRIGHSFLDTVRNCCRHQGGAFPKKVLRAVVETLDEANMPAVHAIRTGPGGDDPQRKRKADGAGAMRRDIDRDFHLHYWSCPDGIVELASINYPHDDFSIPE